MLVGLHQRGIPVDLILFADTGGEQPSTYAYLPIMNQWLAGHGMPQITVVKYTEKNWWTSYKAASCPTGIAVT